MSNNKRTIYTKKRKRDKLNTRTKKMKGVNLSRNNFENPYNLLSKNYNNEYYINVKEHLGTFLFTK